MKSRKFIIPRNYYLFNNNLLASSLNWNTSSYFDNNITFDDGGLSLGFDCFVSCKRNFKHGIFSCDICLPTGYKANGCFSFSGVLSKTTRINVVESFCGSDGFIRKIKPGMLLRSFYGISETYNSCNICVDNANDWHNYVLWWDDDFVKIYYDGHLVYECDEHIPDVFMSLSLSNCVHPLGEAYDKHLYMPMKVRNLKYYKKYE